MPDRRSPFARLPRGVLALVATLTLVASACGGSDDGPSAATTAADSDRAAATSSAPAAAGRFEIATAAVPGAVDIFAAKGDATPSETISNPTEYDLPRVFLVAQRDGDWLEVWLPKRPNQSKGWVRASDVTVQTTDYKLVVDVPNSTITLYEGDEATMQFPVGTAQETYPTPAGTYFITDSLEPPDPDTVYGTHAYGLSGYSEVLQSFNGGDGQLGIHGTNRPESIGQQASHGCIRLNNDDIEQLVPLLPLGTPVEIIV